MQDSFQYSASSQKLFQHYHWTASSVLWPNKYLPSSSSDVSYHIPYVIIQIFLLIIQLFHMMLEVSRFCTLARKNRKNWWMTTRLLATHPPLMISYSTPDKNADIIKCVEWMSQSGNLNEENTCNNHFPSFFIFHPCPCHMKNSLKHEMKENERNMYSTSLNFFSFLPFPISIINVLKKYTIISPPFRTLFLNRNNIFIS